MEENGVPENTTETMIDVDIDTTDSNITKSCCNSDVQYLQIEVESGEHKYYFKMPVGTQIGRAYDASFSVLNKLADFAKQAVEDMKVKNKENSEDTEEKKEK